MSYPNLGVVVINDGSPDNTAGALIDEFDLRPVHPIYPTGRANGRHPKHLPLES
ncbi:MAG: hypothetical protein R2706_10730 [Acidimicrobiales bacterium]